MRWALGIEYAGSAYCGWQRQGHAPSVQETLEAALSQVANESIEVTCAGRTDTGVHAVEQLVHFDTESVRNERAWILGGNANLPHDIAIRWATPVSEEFHARYSAFARSYRYVIDNHFSRPAILAQRVTWTHKPLDAEAMHRAAQVLCGEHDFSSFRAQGCQAKHPNRFVESIAVSRGGHYVYIDVKANAFLHHMVRNIAGVLMAVGAGEADEDWVGQVLGYRDRTRGGVTAPPHGLYFVKAHYPSEFDLPRGIQRPVFE